MAESPTDFIDFNAWKDITSASEAEALQRQQADVNAKEAEAERLLQRSGAEAQRAQSQEAMSNGMATTTLSRTGSYVDFLKAKQSAQNARAMMALGRMGAYGDTRSAVDAQQGYSAGAQAALDRLQAREDRTGAAVDSSASSYTSSAQQDRERIRQQQAAAAARAASDKQATDKFNAGLLAKMRGDWAAMDAKQGSFGFDPAKSSFTIYGDNMAPYGEANSDATRLAQMARNQGYSSEADRYQSGATYSWGKRTKGGY